MSIRLACPQGGRRDHPLTHDLTVGQIERIVYALTAAYGDEVTEQDADSRPDVGGRSEELAPCPIEVLGWASDDEMYREHVEGCYEQARALQVSP